MKHSNEDVDRLIDAVGFIVNGITDPTIQKLADLSEAYKPFGKPKSARIIYLPNNCHVISSEGEGTLFIECTDAVKARNSPTAGVSTLALNNAIDSHKFQFGNTNDKTRCIQALYANTAPDIEGEL